MDGWTGGAGGIVSPNASSARDEPGTRRPLIDCENNRNLQL